MITNKERDVIKYQAEEYLRNRGYDVKTVVFLHEQKTKGGAKSYVAAEEIFTFEITPQEQLDYQPLRIKLLYSLKASKTNPDMYKVRNPYGMLTSQMDIVPDSYIVWIGGNIKDFVMLDKHIFDENWDYKNVPINVVRNLRISKTRSTKTETVYVLDGSELKKI